jgi:GntR family transcriptional regulator
MAKEVTAMLSLNLRDARPLHEQAREEIRRLIIAGALPPEEKLPAVRELAASLAINPNTIARAYRDLEAEGYLYSVAGRGTFVCRREHADRQRVGGLLAQWDRITAELLYLGEGIDPLTARMRTLAAPGGGAL